MTELQILRTEFKETVDVCIMYMLDLDPNKDPVLWQEASEDVKYYGAALAEFERAMCEGNEAEALKIAKNVLRKGI